MDGKLTGEKSCVMNFTCVGFVSACYTVRRLPLATTQLEEKFKQWGLCVEGPVWELREHRNSYITSLKGEMEMKGARFVGGSNE